MFAGHLSGKRFYQYLQIRGIVKGSFDGRARVLGKMAEPDTWR